MNEALEKLYRKNWDNLVSEIQKTDKKSAQPLLLKVSDEYIQADIKVMLVGQETNGWGICFNEKQESVNDLMQKYQTYFYETRKERKQDRKRAFWNKRNFKYFEEKLKQYFSNQKVELIWNNISKIGNYGNGKGIPHQCLKSIEREHFNLIKDETLILKPDIIIFTTGSRDAYIRHHFGSGTKFIPLLHLEGDKESLKKSINLLSEVKLEECNDIVAIRVQHPNRRALDNSIIFTSIVRAWSKSQKTNS